QSVGGGGGIAGQLDAPSGALVGSSGGSGSGGAVTVTYSGTLSTSGSAAHGIFAQSAGGQGTGGAVSVTVGSGASVSTQGANAYGIVAQSVGLQGNGTIAVAIAQTATVSGGNGTGAGILLQGGSTNTITNQGTLTASGGVASGTAIQVTSAAGQSSVGATTIDNSGTINGQVLFSAGTGTFNNLSGGTFNTGPSLSFGSSGVLSNAGTLSPGGTGQIQTTTISAGSLAQSSGGVLAIDISPSANQADAIVVAGTANLAGSVQANLLNTQTASGALTIVSATGGVATSTQSSLAAPSGTAVITYSLGYPNSNDIVLNYSINYANPTVLASANSNQAALAGGLQQAARSSALDSSLSGLLGIATVGGYLAALDSLTPQIMSDHQIATLFSGMQFSDALLSCAARDGAYRFIRQDSCGWARVDAWGLSRPTSTLNRAFNFSSFQIAAGGQVDVGDDWLLGGGLSVEFQNMAVESLAWSKGTFGQLGLVAKRTFGDTLLSASLAAGYGQYNVSRRLFNGATAASVLPHWMIAGQLRAAHAFEYGNVYVKPRVDAGFQYLGTGALTESGAAGAGLSVQASGQTYLTIQPAIELGGDVMLGGTLVRPNIMVGLTQFIGSASPTVTASFLSAPSVAPFTINSTFARTYLDIGANIDVFVQGNVVLSLQGAGKFSDSTIGYGGGLKAALKF
ncbi:MAG: autotransporter domain-containing protein, partial [Reyranella sp.]